MRKVTAMKEQRKIEVALDCVSPWSYIAFHHLYTNREVLEQHGVDVDFVPVFLGGINVGTGNKPPGHLPAKAAYSSYDLPRGQAYFGLPKFKVPAFFPFLSLRPQRCLLYTQTRYTRQQYERLFYELFRRVWLEHHDLSKPDLMANAVACIFPDEKDQQAVLAAHNDPEIKQQLNASTARAYRELGAFGCPFFWVTRGEISEPFFGTDHFEDIWAFLGVPHCGKRLLKAGDRTCHERPQPAKL